MEEIQCLFFQHFLEKRLIFFVKVKSFFFDSWIKCCRRSKHRINETNILEPPGPTKAMNKRSLVKLILFKV